MLILIIHSGRLALLPTSVLLASVEYLNARDVLVFTSTCRSTMLWTSDVSSLHGIDVFWRRIYERATLDFASLAAAAPLAVAASNKAVTCCPKGRLLDQSGGPFCQVRSVLFLCKTTSTFPPLSTIY
jgi:hypothetical protein